LRFLTEEGLKERHAERGCSLMEDGFGGGVVFDGGWIRRIRVEKPCLKK
jgi:hypothetical protein